MYIHVHLLCTLHFRPHMQLFAQIFVYWAEFLPLKGQSGYSCRKILIADCIALAEEATQCFLVILRFSCFSSNVALTPCLSPKLFPTSSQRRITKCFGLLFPCPSTPNQNLQSIICLGHSYLVVVAAPVNANSSHSNFLFFVLSLSPNQMRDRLPLRNDFSLSRYAFHAYA